MSSHTNNKAEGNTSHPGGKFRKRVALVGHCVPDSSHLTMVVTRAMPDAQVIRTTSEEQVRKVLADGVDLVLVNRAMEPGYPESLGTDYLRRLKRERPDLQVMLISNYQDAQQEAVNAGALPGFGKSELMTERVTHLLREALKASDKATADAATA